MTVKELIKKLEHYPEDMEVFIAQRRTDFSFGLLNRVTHNEIDICETPNSEVLSSQEVVILDEE